MKIDRLDIWIRWLVTFFIYSFYIASVFFVMTGNYQFLFTYSYWWTTISTTSLSIFLRWLFSDSGLEKELLVNDKIKGKEREKSILIQEVHDKDLVDELKIDIDKKNEDLKLEAYKNKCDLKINFYSRKSWYKLFRKKLLNKWRNNKREIYTDEFNLAIIKVSCYQYNIDEMLSSFYKENGNERRRKTKNMKVVNSTRANVLTFLFIAILRGAEFLIKDFSREDIMVLLGQIIVFTLNIYNGNKLGKNFVKEDYSQNLTDDYVFLKTFLKKHKGGLVNATQTQKEKAQGIPTFAPTN